MLVVETRAEFKKAFIEHFIPGCNKDDFDFAYAMHNWEGFAVTKPDGEVIEVNMREHERSLEEQMKIFARWVPKHNRPWWEKL